MPVRERRRRHEGSGRSSGRGIPGTGSTSSWAISGPRSGRSAGLGGWGRARWVGAALGRLAPGSVGRVGVARRVRACGMRFATNPPGPFGSVTSGGLWLRPVTKPAAWSGSGASSRSQLETPAALPRPGAACGNPNAGMPGAVRGKFRRPQRIFHELRRMRDRRGKSGSGRRIFHVAHVRPGVS